jgi:hypothetical protein
MLLILKVDFDLFTKWKRLLGNVALAPGGGTASCGAGPLGPVLRQMLGKDSGATLFCLRRLTWRAAR